jgi:hypothetical protein
LGLQAEKLKFSQLSQHEKKMLISVIPMKLLLEEMKYSKIKSTNTQSNIEKYMVWKKDEEILHIIYCLPCQTSLLQEDLSWITFKAPMEDRFALKEKLPIPDQFLKDIEVVKRLVLLPVLSSVPDSRVVKAQPYWRKAGGLAHYYVTTLRKPFQTKGEKFTLLPSSSELLIIDKIRSVSDFFQSLRNAITEAEKDNNTIVSLNPINMLP